ncbi:MAG: arsenate reductase ArsC [Spirochaetaceae bacterium]|nr:MAG: arsenate reductase ArsC [Spirochaetaceae bacterium]
MVNILFVCIHNSGRSQMAEAFLNNYHDQFICAESAGLEAGTLNPLVVESMKETGVDISHNKTKTVMEILETGKAYDYVVTVCDQAQAERCPFFPGNGRRLHWDFTDPSSFEGSRQEILTQIRDVRDKIHDAVNNLVSMIRETTFNSR